MIVEGRGMIAAAFLAGRPAIGATIFARGVADSTMVDPVEYARELVTLDDAVRSAAAIGQPLVYFSSAPVYGQFNGHAFAESEEPAPVTAYGRHKLSCEAIVRASPGPSLILRLPNVIGPGGNPHQLIPALVRQVTAGFVTVLDGAARDVLDVDDLVSIVARLVAGDAPARLADHDRTVNVASGICTPVSAIVSEIASILGRDPDVDLLPGGEPQRFSTDRLRALGVDPPAGSDYLARILARRVPVIAATTVPATAGQAMQRATSVSTAG
jgi:nucleoside-diphosphate-sugar epimerase